MEQRSKNCVGLDGMKTSVDRASDLPGNATVVDNSTHCVCVVVYIDELCCPQESMVKH